jgi:Transposase DDE domain group 1
MPTECSAALFEFARVEGRSVVSAFDGGKITSDAGALLLSASDRAVGLIDRFAHCFSDRRSPGLVAGVTTRKCSECTTSWTKHERAARWYVRSTLGGCRSGGGRSHVSDVPRA